MIRSDAELATSIATCAGELLLTLQRSRLFEGAATGKIGDRLSNEFILSALRENRPDDGVLSEEAKDDRTRLGRSRVWIVDPLDGTREYGEARSDWAVHVALAVDGQPRIGAVALPGLSVTLRSDQPCGLAGEGKPLRMLVSRTRPAAQAVAVAEGLGAELVPMGSAGAKAMAVVRGEADIYLHSGGQYEWDSCAPIAVAQAAGLHTSRLDGSALIYNRENVYLPDLLICHRHRAPQILELLRTMTP
ncbi:MAG: 3'(2'),5'-bisphosphate nucleotidase CysQ [Steroidobacteraceae bacterium]